MIDQEWAESLIGLRMAVPDKWWDGYSGLDENKGFICGIDFENASSAFFCLQLDDDEEGSTYPMRYDAVYNYADDKDIAYSSFKLTKKAMKQPDNEEVVVYGDNGIDDHYNSDDDFPLCEVPLRTQAREKGTSDDPSEKNNDDDNDDEDNFDDDCPLSELPLRKEARSSTNGCDENCPLSELQKGRDASTCGTDSTEDTKSGSDDEDGDDLPLSQLRQRGKVLAGGADSTENAKSGGSDDASDDDDTDDDDREEDDSDDNDEEEDDEEEDDDDYWPLSELSRRRKVNSCGAGTPKQKKSGSNDNDGNVGDGDDDDSDNFSFVESRQEIDSSSNRTDDNDEDDDEVQNKQMNEPRVYKKSGPEEWISLGKEDVGLPVEPIPWTGGDEEASVRITDDELQGLKDADGNIRFWKVVEWSLPTIDGIYYFDFLAARIRNYMVYIIETKQYTPRYFKTNSDRVVSGDHVARFLGCHCARMLRGFPEITRCWSTRESLDAIAVVKESMPQDAYLDLHRCLHIVDDWDNEALEGRYERKCDVKEGTARHRRKYGNLEDAHWRRWQAMVRVGMALTADESRVAGWYHGPITIGPEPKPIRTGATLHTLCITKGPLATFKLFVRAYGGRNDEDLCQPTSYCSGVQKWVNLFDIMLDSFKNVGHLLTCDSAYLGEIMADIARVEWGLNIVGTSQANRNGADTDDFKNKLKIGSYESLAWQRTDNKLTFCIWGDNNFVRTLSNYHQPLRLVGGLMRKKKGEDRRREREQTPVPCPAQNKTYSQNFHLIDKGNGAEANYDLGGESHTHGWQCKLSFRYLNMTIENAATVYNALITEHTPTRLKLPRRDGILELVHVWCQRGSSMRTYRPEHPLPLRNIESVLDPASGRRRRSDAQGFVGGRVRQEKVVKRMSLLRRKQTRGNGWRTHQSVSAIKRGKCSYKRCSGLKNNKNRRPYDTCMRCEECSLELGKDVYFCNTTKGSKLVVCHITYHNKFCKLTSPVMRKTLVATNNGENIRVTVANAPVEI